MSVARRLTQRLGAIPPLLWVLLVTAFCLAPFCQKAFHIDDTLFLRAARQIQSNPLDFYGFQMNWFGKLSPMTEVFDNPPLAAYYIALVTALAGWSEPVLHSAFLLVALAAAWGVFSLARYHCRHPWLAALATVLTPVFIVSGTTVMCDMLLLAFWVWAMVWFEKGLAGNHRTSFAICGTLIGLAFLTKYVALALLPLLAVYAVCRQRRAGAWLVAVLLPLLFVVAYEWFTFRTYGKGLLASAAGYSANFRARGHPLSELIVGLEFVGGCFLPLLFCAPWLWSRRHLLRGTVLVVLCLLLPFAVTQQQRLLWQPDARLDWVNYLQTALFLASACQVLLLVVCDFHARRDPSSLLLVLWVTGLLVFAMVLNWTMNARSLLPMVPAVAILLARRMESQPAPESPKTRTRSVLWPAVASAALCLSLAWADQNLANTWRAAANQVCAGHLRPKKTVWFQGHWGFQYYMEQRGAQALERAASLPARGDIIVVPAKSPNIWDLPANCVRLLEILEFPNHSRFSTVNYAAGASFYAALGQPFPFTLGPNAPERFFVFVAERSFTPGAIAAVEFGEKGAVAHQFELQLRAHP